MPGILVVDDSESKLAFLESILQEASRELFVAFSGTEALSNLKKQALELVITDLYMPDGIELMRFERDLRVPFIAISEHPPLLRGFWGRSPG